MTEGVVTPRVQPGGVVTVAFLKAQLDEGSDHLGIFMPLVLDAISRLQASTFTTADVQDALARHHEIAMPQQAVATLLGRATRKKYLERAMGRYRRNTSHPMPRSNVAAEKDKIQQGQKRLGEALRDHAARRQFTIASSEAALEMLFRFLEQEQIALLLGTPAPTVGAADTTRRERAVVAEFIDAAIKDDPALRAVLRSILEGLVLYHAAFLPDLNTQTRNFRNLQVAFDSVLVRQTLGYEGTAMRALLRDAINALNASGVKCLVFDKTVHEIQRILSMYEDRLGTEAGRRSLRPVPMARHFLTQRYSRSDVREMAALLEHDVVAAGLQIRETPERVPEYTASEPALAQRLADPRTKDDLEPRVQHDVDCVAAILTLRRGRSSTRIEEAGAVFATSSPLVIRNTRLWYYEDEHGTGVEPIVHIRGLTNLAWLKKPTLCSDLKERELVALCAAALRPKQDTWQRFLRHLESLEQSQRLSSDEVTAIVASAMSDRLLREAEGEDPSDVDAVTLDEIVDRVKESYAAKAEERILEITEQYDSRLAEVAARERAASAEAEKGRRQELLREERARGWARFISRALYLIVSALVLAGAVALIVGHPFHTGWFGVLLGIAVVVFVCLELLGILRHVSEWRALMEVRLTRRFRDWLSGDVAVRGETRPAQ